jgi:hypothetical protein
MSDDKADYYWMPDESKPPRFVSWFWEIYEDHGLAHGPFDSKDAARADRAAYLRASKNSETV